VYVAKKVSPRHDRLTPPSSEGGDTDGHNRRRRGISVGGILVIAGILILIFWSFWLGLIVALIGLVAFGGFVRGKWY
jgi:hypothetical protein